MIRSGSIGETTRPVQCECVINVIFNFVIAAASSDTVMGPLDLNNMVDKKKVHVFA